MSPEGKPKTEKKPEIAEGITTEDEETFMDIIKRMEEKHPNLKVYREKKEKLQPEITLEQMFGKAKAAKMRREAEAHDRQTPRDSK